MRKSKINDYHLTAAIHTLEIKVRGIVKTEHLSPEVARCLKMHVEQVLRDSDPEHPEAAYITRIIVNVNKLMGDQETFSGFNTALDTVLTEAGIDNYDFVRVDLRLDSHDPGHYRKYAKLHRYLISAIAMAYSVENCYRSEDLFSQQQLSVAIKNRYFELENYDKAAEIGDPAIDMSRLEERSKSFHGQTIPEEFLTYWPNRWNKAMKNLNAVHARYNDNLLRLYQEGCASHEFRSLAEFIRRYQGCIFCKAQLIDLVQKILHKDQSQAKSYAETVKKRDPMEYFSRADLDAAVAEIHRATEQFFRS